MFPKTAKVFCMIRHFNGEPKPSDFELREASLPSLQEGDLQLEAEWLSVDPYMRIMMNELPEGSKMIGSQIARVVESRNKHYAVGDYVVCKSGWASHSVCNPDLLSSHDKKVFYKLPTNNSPLSYALGAMGTTGISAYFGLLEICKPKPGETVVVSGAAGAVGIVAGQIARIKGCRVIGFAGSDEKVEILKKFRFDFAFNYKKVHPIEALKEAAPDGVDCYFDNVGGAFSSAVISRMNHGGRISACGSISSYNDDWTDLTPSPTIQQFIVFKELYMEGFLSRRWVDRFPEARDVLRKWLTEGEILPLETVYEGFETMPEAFIGLFRGENTGKALVRAQGASVPNRSTGEH